MELTEKIEITFRNEFGPISKFFTIHFLTVQEARESDLPSVYSPGVYIWFDHEKVIKVGRHFENARKRALEHLQDNTGNKMAALEQNPKAKVCLITTDQDNIHWIAAAEMFLEKALEPSIKSKRMG